MREADSLSFVSSPPRIRGVLDDANHLPSLFAARVQSTEGQRLGRVEEIQVELLTHIAARYDRGAVLWRSNSAVSAMTARCSTISGSNCEPACLRSSASAPSARMAGA